jgi:hypothetical protein
MAFLERWSYRIGLLILFLMAASFVRFVAEWLNVRAPI